MCLGRVYRRTEKKDFLTSLPNVVTVWKCVALAASVYYPCFNNKHKHFATGLNETRGTWKLHTGLGTLNCGYLAGFHSFRCRKQAIKWTKDKLNYHTIDDSVVVVRAKVPKSSIVACGTQDGYEVIVSTKIYMPKFRRRK